MKKVLVMVFIMLVLGQVSYSQDKLRGVRGDPKVIAEASSQLIPTSS